jgi:hypothetical protein
VSTHPRLSGEFTAELRSDIIVRNGVRFVARRRHDAADCGLAQ